LQARRVLDDERAAKRKLKLDDDGDDDDKLPGHAVCYEEIEPWPEPVDGAALLDELVSSVCWFVVMPKHGPEITVLWSAHTYVIDATDITPRLQVKSPMKGCGKSVNFDFLEEIVYRPDPSSSLSMSSFLGASTRTGRVC
jgi:hypothetical protein